jgi:hypothetical protein
MEFRLSSESARRGKLQLYSGLLDELTLGGVHEEVSAWTTARVTYDNSLFSLNVRVPSVGSFSSALASWTSWLLAGSARRLSA